MVHTLPSLRGAWAMVKGFKRGAQARPQEMSEHGWWGEDKMLRAEHGGGGGYQEHSTGLGARS